MTMALGDCNTLKIYLVSYLCAAQTSCWTAIWWQSWQTLVWPALCVVVRQDALRVERRQLVKQRQ